MWAAACSGRMLFAIFLRREKFAYLESDSVIWNVFPFQIISFGGAGTFHARAVYSGMVNVNGWNQATG